MIAVDSSVLIDFIGDDPVDAELADAVLRRALAAGPVVACEVVVAELVAGLGNGSLVIDALEQIGIEFSPLEQRAAVRAGEMQRRWAERRLAAVSASIAARNAVGKASSATSNTAVDMSSRTVPDFLIGAHAMLQCQGLITRDQSFFRDYFKGLKIIVP